MTRLFLDTEFTGLHQGTTLISLALVAETGEEFYAEFTDCDLDQVDDWIEENVLSGLYLQTKHHAGPNTFEVLNNTEVIAMTLSKWLRQFESSVEIWSDVLAYDFVLFCELFGGAQNLPSNVFYIPFDLATVFKLKGLDPDLNREEFAALSDSSLPQHNALRDARVQRRCFEICMSK
ncbi:MAG: 3'-5' exoribonuclease [Patescibacteria group bacterium]